MFKSPLVNIPTVFSPIFSGNAKYSLYFNFDARNLVKKHLLMFFATKMSILARINYLVVFYLPHTYIQLNFILKA